MPVVVLDLPEGPAVDHGVLLIPARPLLALVGRHRHAAKFNPFDGTPGLFLPLKDRDSVESGILEGLEKKVFPEGTRNAPAPEFGALLEFLRNVLVAHDIRNDCSASPAQHAEDLGEESVFVFRADEIQDAIGNDYVDGIVRDEWAGAPEFVDIGL